MLIFDRSRRLVASVTPAAGKEGRFVDLATGGDGGVFVLDGRARTVVEIRQARTTRTIDLRALGVVEPVALAVDGLGDLFVLDGKSGNISIADSEGRKISEIRLPRDVKSRLGTPTALAVDHLGRVYLGGKKDGQIVRFR